MTSEQTLVQAFQGGDRDAFAKLIAKYQNYISTIAYSSTGDFDRSEEITQQTFVTAWQKQADLRDPGKLLGWLSGIARNLLRNDHRKRAKEKRLVVSQAQDAPAPDASPVQRCIDEEQSRILWSILEQIPTNYREPLILYYREEKSVATVAELMSLSEDAVRQRLARGRKLVKAEIAHFVEESLFETKPNSRLTASIIAALPAAGSGAVAKAGGSILGGLIPLKFILLAIGPLIGVAGAIFGSKRSLDQATSHQERAFLWQLIWGCTALVGVLLLFILLGQFVFPRIYSHPLVQVAIWGGYGLALVAFITYGNMRIREIKSKFGTDEEQRGTRANRINPVSTTGMRWNLIGAIAGVFACVFLSSALAGDWLFFGLSLLSAGALVAYVWVHAPLHTTAPAQLRFNGLVSLACCFVVSIQLLLRWDYWYQRLPFQAESTPWMIPQVSGWILALFVMGLGIAIYALLRWQARKLDAQIKGTN